MDPEATIDQIEQNIVDGDDEEAMHSMMDLIEWLAKGGAAPANLARRLNALRAILDDDE